MLSNYINGLDVNNTIPTGKMLSTFTQTDGRVEYTTTDILSSYVVGLSEYIESEINKLDVDKITLSSGSNLSIITSISETDGKINVECDKLVGTVYIKDEFDSELSNGMKSDLSVVKTSYENYADILRSEIGADPRTIYILPNDYLNAFGSQLCNLTMYNEQYAGIAATDTYVNTVSSNVTQEVKEYVDTKMSSFKQDSDLSVFFSDDQSELSSLGVEDCILAIQKIIKSFAS